MRFAIILILFLLHLTTGGHAKPANFHKIYGPIRNEFVSSAAPDMSNQAVYVRTIAKLVKGDTLYGNIKMEPGWSDGDFSRSMLCRRVLIVDDKTDRSRVYGADRICWFSMYFDNGRVETFYSSVKSGFVPVKQRETDDLHNLGYGVFLHYIKGEKLKEFKEYYWTYNRQIFISAYIASIYLVKNDKEIFSYTHRKRSKKDEIGWEEKLLTFVSDCDVLTARIKLTPGEVSADDMVNIYDHCNEGK